MSIHLPDELRASLPGEFIKLPAGVTYYELAGPVDCQLVALIHGLSVPSYIWEPAFKALTRAGLRVLRYDLFGRGYSDRPKVAYTLDFFEQQLADLLDALDIRRPLSVIGLSMGAPIAAAYAAHQPERVARLGLIDPAGLLDWDTPTLRLLRLPVLGELFMKFKGEQFVVSSQAGDFYRPERFPGYGELARPQLQYPGYRRALLSTLRRGPLYDLSELYIQVGKSGMPTLLVWGRYDQTFPFALSQKALQLIPQAELHAIVDAGHIPHYERSEVVNPILIEFLSSL